LRLRQSFLEDIHRFPSAVFLAARVHNDIVSRSLQVIDLIYIDENDSTRRFDGQPPLSITGNGVDEPAEASRLRALETQLTLGPPKSTKKPTRVQSLEDVVHSVHFESLQRVPVVGRHKYDTRHVLHADFFDHTEPVKLGNLDVQKSDIRLKASD